MEYLTYQSENTLQAQLHIQQCCDDTQLIHNLYTADYSVILFKNRFKYVQICWWETLFSRVSVGIRE